MTYRVSQVINVSIRTKAVEQLTDIIAIHRAVPLAHLQTNEFWVGEGYR